MSERSPQPASALLSVRVQPRAGREEVTALPDGTLRVRVTAVPEKGRANEAVERALARRLGVPRTWVRVVKGGASPEKRVAVEGLSAEEALRRLRTPG